MGDISEKFSKASRAFKTASQLTRIVSDLSQETANFLERITTKLNEQLTTKTELINETDKNQTDKEVVPQNENESTDVGSRSNTE